MEILKVSSHSSPNSVAGAVAGVIREQKAVEVQAVGAGAANQAIKAIAIARGYPGFRKHLNRRRGKNSYQAHLRAEIKLIAPLGGHLSAFVF